MRLTGYLVAAAAWAGALTVCGVATANPITSLYNTGTDAAHATLPDGTLGDPHYALVSVPPNSVTTTLIRTSVGGFPIGPYSADDPLSTWIGPDSTNFPGEHFGGVNDLIDYPGTYVYRTTFNLAGLDPNSAVITGGWQSDNDGLDIRINGVSLGYTTLSDQYQQGFAAFTVNHGFVPGINTLDFVVDNVGTNNGPTALRVEMTGTANLRPVVPAIPVPTLGAWAVVALCSLLLGVGLVTVGGRKKTL